MTLAVLAQDGFQGGIWRLTEPQRAPENTVYDAVNALLDDEGSIYRRGGSSYLGTATGAANWLGFAYVDLGSLGKYVGWSATDDLVTFDTPLATKISLGFSDRPPGPAKPVVVGGIVAFPSRLVANGVLMWGGGLPTGPTGATTASITEGSKTVTGTGTFWLTNVTPGALFFHGSALGETYVVDSVQSDTSLTLRSAAVNTASGPYAIQMSRSEVLPTLLSGSGDVSAVAAVGNRLVVCKDSRAAFSNARPLGGIGQFEDTNYHQLSADATTLGAEGFRDTLVWFTTRGVWTVSNMALDLTDDYGNVQQQIRQVNKDLILWGHPNAGGACGVVGWGGALVVPARDDVHLFSVDGQSKTISDAIRPLYRSYVRAGYYPGTAQVYNGHYVLPILDSSFNVIDTLVCKLQGSAWTRWTGKSRAFTVKPATATATERLEGTWNGRLADFTACFDGSGATDADGTVFSFQVTTRQFTLSRQTKAFWKWLRVRYEQAGGGMTAEKANGTGSWSSLAGSADPDDGTDPFEWFVDERSQAVSFRFTTSGSPTRSVLRNFEVHARPTGKR